MEENIKQNTVIEEVVEEVKSTDENQLREVIEKWLNAARTAGLKLGAQMISAAVFSIMQKHLKKKTKPSLRDYERCFNEVMKLISAQLTQQNDSEGEADEVIEEINE